MAKNGKMFLWKHRWGIRRAAMTAGMIGGGALGLGAAATFRIGGSGYAFLGAGTTAGTLGGYALSEKLTGHFKPRPSKAMKPQARVQQVTLVRKPRSIFQIG